MTEGPLMATEGLATTVTGVEADEIHPVDVCVKVKVTTP
jgi:hypothetical protein